MKFLIIFIILIILIILIVALALGLGLKHEKFSTESVEYIISGEDKSYLVYDTKKFTFYLKDDKVTTNKLWAEKVDVNGSIIRYLTKMSKKYNMQYVIIKEDFDIIFSPRHLSEKYLYFVSCRNYNSNPYTFAIPQNDDYFNNVRIKDNIPFKKKKNSIVWRGRIHGKTRVKFLSEIKKIENFTIDIVSTTSKSIYSADNNINVNYLSTQDQLKNKYILAIDGYGWPGSINWTLESKSCAFILSNNFVWYYELLEPWVDYVPIKNFDDMIESLKILENDQELAEQIGINGSEKIKKILNLQQKYIELIFSNSGKTYIEVIYILKKYLT